MKILFAASELAPLAKTGGLADVAGALPRALTELGHDVRAVMPFYGTISREKYAPKLVMPEVLVSLPAGRRALRVWETTSPSEPVFPIYLLEDAALFDRPQLYAEAGVEYPDNALRFAYYCMAAIWMLKGLHWIPDVIVCNDWQTALIPTYLVRNRTMRLDPQLGKIRTLFAIHNLSYQGLYPNYLVYQLGVPWAAFNPYEMEFWGRINLLKGGLVHSHKLVTVSPTYAREIQTDEFGCGLEGLLHTRRQDLTGILNGIDTQVWNPAQDPNLAAAYTRQNKRPKEKCKRDLQEQFGLPLDTPRKQRPLLTVISRLANQKGFDLLTEIMPQVLRTGAQFVLLGTGQPEYHDYFRELAAAHPQQVGLELGFNDALAHQIEAGGDIFLMPSHFEPCGLNQLYSLRYGNVPVVRKTGGLADSIINATPATLKAGKATGFMFTEYKPAALLAAVRKAVATYENDRTHWRKLMDAGMQQDFSWERSAREYETIMQGMLDAMATRGGR
jgi:starch synthase